jgi:hypothetical protein|mmetsp:Transcript_31693/g.94837  ORF Transcript_31693/g.94837 Transcript_31693/m.94837 type:complete len:320 (-) Transcript_31693:352-1311(-)|eukprot:CAMPEP_0113538980 /NCGR_PEP_ID=MMETSP0015_2-20120614/7667_1 /TAXON_ID=2838 /ORGANISM="Odontella" /LENGTH=319 /DNA_ID=CAMNT_0000438615 /DNA_START=185 /DNA_END=1144 /DNA_ORIENTATION=+ /assembly_acc=CAM_ASM_000160
MCSSKDNHATDVSAPVINEKPKLTLKNWLNLVFFVLNTLFTYGVGNEGWFGGQTNGDLSRKYQTIITPSSRAFTIWAVIFLSQGIFSVAQMLPRFRARTMLLDGASYWYPAVCVFQIGWTFSFAFEVIPLSLVFMLLILASLYGILYSQYYTESDGSKIVEFWLLRFPFAIHAGWISAASALNTSVVAVWTQAPADAQLALGIVSLAVLHAVSVWVLFNLKKEPNYTIACVLSWANGWIYSELQEPKDLVISTFSADSINGVANAAFAVSFIILTQIVVRFGMEVFERLRGEKMATEEQVDAAHRSEHQVDHELFEAKV